MPPFDDPDEPVAYLGCHPEMPEVLFEGIFPGS
jgi:hypothetical protein